MRVYLIISLTNLILLSGCFNAPEYPLEPTIDFDQVEFIRGDQTTLDSLILTINFTDGDGDIGLFPDENNAPYNDITPIPRNDGSQRIITYTERNTPPWDTLPPYEFPYSCSNYLTPESHGIETYLNDTIYVQPNENHFNIFVDYFVRENGQYVEFDWESVNEPECSLGFDGRFPVLGDLNSDRPLEGKLRYGMVSAGFALIFRNDTLKLRVSIKDRALNNSNVIETPEFVLSQIEVQ